MIVTPRLKEETDQIQFFHQSLRLVEVEVRLMDLLPDKQEKMVDQVVEGQLVMQVVQLLHQVKVMLVVVL